MRLKSVLPNKEEHKSRKYGSGLHHKERVIAFLVATAEVGVVPVIVVQERSLAADGARRDYSVLTYRSA
jgi:hypothetical protein